MKSIPSLLRVKEKIPEPGRGIKKNPSLKEISEGSIKDEHDGYRITASTTPDGQCFYLRLFSL